MSTVKVIVKSCYLKKKTLYLPALSNGFAKGSLDPPLLGSLRCSWPLPPVECPHSKQLAMGAPKPNCSCVCPFRHGAVVWCPPLSLLTG
ncbi:hypothetical protein AB205_0079440 [Aquarana catesbeiana]|uniref:Uncharacterized protein n=1 Tax=Aquarana catesbeiana TaxID=8400 RepID=A0A2G9R916_AQUCT|nr:hypothetical protein AB205_0079440 [Aquarana catesbeiana]